MNAESLICSSFFAWVTLLTSFSFLCVVVVLLDTTKHPAAVEARLIGYIIEVVIGLGSYPRLDLLDRDCPLGIRQS